MNHRHFCLGLVQVFFTDLGLPRNRTLFPFPHRECTRHQGRPSLRLHLRGMCNQIQKRPQAGERNTVGSDLTEAGQEFDSENLTFKEHEVRRHLGMGWET